MIKNYYSLRKLGKPYGLTCSKMAGIGLCSLLLCASPQAALADVSHADAVEAVLQTSQIKGTVVDNTGFGVIGAAVVVKGTTNGTVTDFDGNFVIDAKVGDVLEISYVGYKTVTIKATAQPMNITMEEDTEQLDEVVVVGYGSTTKRDLIASVSTVKAEQISNMPVANIAQGLAGRSPGMIVTANGGGVNSKPSISIRGGGEPLYVIDGIIRSSADFQNLSPDDIASMSILKDASATAVYGSRATNGIVQIVTKQGKEGKTAIEYDFNQSFAQPSIWPEKMNTYDRAIYSNIAAANDGLSEVYNQEALNHLKNGTDLLNFNNTDWRKLVLNDWAPQQKHTVRLTGGSETNNY
jgi:TonB-linked SusC/RagA family outer membrane protein